MMPACLLKSFTSPPSHGHHSHGSRVFPIMLSIHAVLLFSIAIHSAESRVFMDDGRNGLFSRPLRAESGNPDEAEIQTVEDSSQQQPEEQPKMQQCDILQNDAIHALMDRICELCHDMFSHQKPNTRAECRSDCFRSNNFKKCLRLFKPIGPNSGQKRRIIRTLPEAEAAAMDALFMMEMEDKL